jgi:VanZ family protein
VSITRVLPKQYSLFVQVHCRRYERTVACYVLIDAGGFITDDFSVRITGCFFGVRRLFALFTSKSGTRAALVVAALCLVVLFVQPPGGAKWTEPLSNAGHGWVFGIIAASLLGLRRQSRRSRPLTIDVVVCIASAILIGTAIEAMQYLIDRDAEIQDVVMDGIGAIAGTGAYVFASNLQGRRGRMGAQSWAGFLSAVVAASFFTVPVAVSAAAYVVRNRNFPVLMDANRSLGTYFVTNYQVDASKRLVPPPWQPEQAEQAGYRVHLGGKRSWGLGLLETARDWRPWNAVAMDIVNPTHAPLEIKARFFSGDKGLAQKSGFIVPITVPASSRTTYAIELKQLQSEQGTHRVELSDVRGLVLSPRQQNRAEEFYLVRVWLQ